MRQLLADGMYVVDETAVAGAIIAREYVRAAVAEPEFRSDRQMPGRALLPA